ncbi:unnamed protein product [Boreogadus saida]
MSLTWIVHQERKNTQSGPSAQSSRQDPTVQVRQEVHKATANEKDLRGLKEELSVFKKEGKIKHKETFKEFKGAEPWGWDTSGPSEGRLVYFAAGFNTSPWPAHCSELMSAEQLGSEGLEDPRQQ